MKIALLRIPSYYYEGSLNYESTSTYALLSWAVCLHMAVAMGVNNKLLFDFDKKRKRSDILFYRMLHFRINLIEETRRIFRRSSLSFVNTDSRRHLDTSLTLIPAAILTQAIDQCTWLYTTPDSETWLKKNIGHLPWYLPKLINWSLLNAGRSAARE